MKYKYERSDGFLAREFLCKSCKWDKECEDTCEAIDVSQEMIYHLAALLEMLK